MMTTAEFMASKLGQDLNREYGFDEATWDRMASYWSESEAAANDAGNSPSRRGRAALKVKLRYAKEFGATPDELVRIERYDRGPASVVGSDLLPRKWSMLFYGAMVISKAPGLADGTVNQACGA